MKKKIILISCLLSFVFINHPNNHDLYAQTNPNTITFENKSGEFGLVKVIGPTEHIIEVPNTQSRTVNIAEGEYYILVRYGSNPEKYKYSKGDPFNVTQTANEYSTLTITLHKVVDGNYETNPISADEFNAHNIKENRVDNTNVSSGEINIDAKSSWFLNAVQDNESLVKLVGKYIEKFYGVSPNYNFDQNDKLMLTYKQSIGESNEIKIYVESLPTWYKKNGDEYKVTEKRIRISAYINISEFINDTTVRNNILEINNKWHNKTWIPHRIFITSNENIALQSSINIPGKDFPIPVEQIRDLLARTVSSWNEYSKELLELVNQSTK